MKPMKNIGRVTGNGLLGVLSCFLLSCNTIYDDAGDCAPTYAVRFIDDMNLNYADAFDAEVNSVSLFAFDSEGTLVWSKTEAGSTIHPGNQPYEMDISELKPGTYTLVAWGDIKDNTSFSIPTLTTGASTLEELTCRLTRTSRDDDGDVVNKRLYPLFHSMAQVTLPKDEEGGEYHYEMQLTKDTKDISVLLQQLSGDPLNPDDYEFTIEADNGHLNYDNSLLADETPFVYKTWDVQATDNSAVVAHLSTSRLIQDTGQPNYTRPMLTVRKTSDGSTILSIPIIDYALLVRSMMGRDAGDQEYLDRQGDYNMTFFLQEGKWVSSVIIINDWRIVLNNDTME